jgi:hypothetical protein
LFPSFVELPTDPRLEEAAHQRLTPG